MSGKKIDHRNQKIEFPNQNIDLLEKKIEYPNKNIDHFFQKMSINKGFENSAQFIYS